jgi:hypothetical protein
MKEPITLSELIVKARKEDELSFAGYTKDYLKKIAIKWIKFLGLTTENENPEENVATSEWIIHFFEIKEEDLK